MYFTVADAFNFFAMEIIAHFPGAVFRFVGHDFPEHPELCVYVMDKKKLSKVKAFCRALKRARVEPPIDQMINIIVKAGVPTQHSESDECWQKKRDDFVRRWKLQAFK